MAHSKRLIAVFLAFMFAYMPYGWAAYATAPTPAGFGGSPGAWKVAAQTGDTTFQNLLKKAPFIPKDYGGTVAKLGSGFRYGSAARVVAARVLFGHPVLLAGSLGLAAWAALSKVRWDNGTQQWQQIVEDGCTSGCLEYTFATASGWASSVSGAGSRWVAYSNSVQQDYGYSLNGCGVSTCSFHYTNLWMPEAPPGDGTLTQLQTRPGPATSGSYQPISTPEEFAGLLEPQPMPSSVPLELPPGTELPIEGEPVNNPGPGTNMTPQTVRVPVGDPVPQPDGTYKQPYVDIVPSPTPDQPWRVDVKPGDKTTTDGAPLPEPAPVKPTDPDPDPTAPPTYDPNDPTTKLRDPALQDLCEKHPGIAACAPYEKPPEPKDPIDPCVEHPDTLGCMPPGELTAEQVPNEDREITLAPDGVWGPSGVCPPARVISLAGGFQLSIPFTALCSFAEMIRPLVIAMAYLGAALMVVGVGRKD